MSLQDAPRWPTPDVDWTWARRRIAFCLVFSPSGRLISIEEPQVPPAAGGGVRRMSVPQLRGRLRGALPNFLWGRTGQALGIRGSRNPLCRYRVDEAAIDAFRRFHQKALLETADPALKTFLTFLDRWSPEMFEAEPGFLDRLDCSLVFRFQYNDVFLHEREASRRIWGRMASETASAIVDGDLAPAASPRRGAQGLNGDAAAHPEGAAAPAWPTAAMAVG